MKCKWNKAGSSQKNFYTQNPTLLSHFLTQNCPCYWECWYLAFLRSIFHWQKIYWCWALNYDIQQARIGVSLLECCWAFLLHQLLQPLYDPPFLGVRKGASYPWGVLESIGHPFCKFWACAGKTAQPCLLTNKDYKKHPDFRVWKMWPKKHFLQWCPVVSRQSRRKILIVLFWIMMIIKPSVKEFEIRRASVFRVPFG